MIRRYVDIREHLLKLRIDKLNLLQLFQQVDLSIEGVLQVLSNSNCVTVCLQKKGLSMAKLFVLLNTMIYYMPRTRVRLFLDVTVVETVPSEAALVKIQQRRVNDLSENEQAAVECLVKSEVEASLPFK